MLREAVEGTMKATAMIMLIVIGSAFLNFVMASTGLTQALTDFIRDLGLSPWSMLLAVVLFYLILGCFMETLSMMITTIPIIAPVMVALGFDPVWFGIIVILLVELALITPPVGLNLFVVQSVRKGGTMGDVILGAIPFVIALLLIIALLSVFPSMVLWLPGLFD
jgi:C4-dicarboxylate transporter DctM subunit